MVGEKFSGLYNAAYEHDACGVGMVVNIHGNKSHELVDNALRVLENMRHRGAEGADNKTGDGAGIMLQIPHEFILLQGIPVPEKGKYGTGLVFLPKDEPQQQAILSIMIEEIEREGLSLMHLRTVPTNPECLGVSALATEPAIKQVFITGVTDDKVPTFERTLYIIRKRIENRVNNKDFYICSLSSKNIVYKGMLSSLQLRQYYPDLTNSYFEGRCAENPKARRSASSKEKRTDCPLLALGLVINAEGFPIVHKVFPGNTSDSKTIPDIVSSLRREAGDTRRPAVVLDGGIATQANLKILLENNYDYIVNGKRTARRNFAEDFKRREAFRAVGGATTGSRSS